jgi:hypothetical protein
LPKDDPVVLEAFLKFLYTGDYTDTVNPTLGKPSVTAMMDPKTVRQNLQQPACGELDFYTSNGNELSSEPDQEWQSPAEEVEEVEEPEEEDESNSSKSSDGCNCHKRETNKLTTECVATIPNQEGLRLVARLHGDMKLPLRLYIMADKYDVPALRLLTRNRFYRAAKPV